jgi:hypothetical protein
MAAATASAATSILGPAPGAAPCAAGDVTSPVVLPLSRVVVLPKGAEAEGKPVGAAAGRSAVLPAVGAAVGAAVGPAVGAAVGARAPPKGRPPGAAAGTVARGAAVTGRGAMLTGKGAALTGPSAAPHCPEELAALQIGSISAAAFQAAAHSGHPIAETNAVRFCTRCAVLWYGGVCQ